MDPTFPSLTVHLLISERRKDQADPQSTNEPLLFKESVKFELRSCFQCNYQAEKKITSFIITEKLFFLPVFFVLCNILN